MKRRSGKGRGIDITSEFTTQANRWKMELSATPTPVSRKFEPLRSWPACPHPTRQRDLDAYHAGVLVSGQMPDGNVLYFGQEAK